MVGLLVGWMVQAKGFLDGWLVGWLDASKWGGWLVGWSVGVVRRSLSVMCFCYIPIKC